MDHVPSPVGERIDPDRGHPAEPAGRNQLVKVIPGVGAAVAVALVATVLGRLAPVVGAPVIAIVGGIVLSMFVPTSGPLRPGLAFSAKFVLQASIVVLGTGLSFGQVLSTGSSSLPVLLGTLTVALVGAGVIGRFLSIDRDLRTLIGVGTGICGASAVAATDAVISASEADVSYAIATIFTFNVLAVLTFPTIGHLIDLSPHTFGLWAGTAVNDMSSVVAASSIFGHGATSTAVVVKLTRTLMIIPISVGIALWRARLRRRSGTTDPVVSSLSHIRSILPIFIGWFLVAVSINTVGLIPRGWHHWLSYTAQLMITVALAAIGLSTRMRDIRRTGLRPLALGAVLWALVGVSSLVLQLATGNLHHT
ncbi:MAG: YeiH family protein [Acidimicrobiales bacterium]